MVIPRNDRVLIEKKIIKNNYYVNFTLVLFLSVAVILFIILDTK